MLPAVLSLLKMLLLLALLSGEDKVMKESDKVIEVEREKLGKNREGGGYISLRWTRPLGPALDADSSMGAVNSAGRVRAPQLTFIVASKDCCWLVYMQKEDVSALLSKEILHMGPLEKTKCTELMPSTTSVITRIRLEQN